jgi:hypothetical protein
MARKMTGAGSDGESDKLLQESTNDDSIPQGQRARGEEQIGGATNYDNNKYDRSFGGIPEMTPRDTKYTRAYDGHQNEFKQGSGWDPLTPEMLAPNPLKSRDFKNVPLTDYASGGQTSTGFDPRDISPGAKRARAAAGMEEPVQYVFGKARRQG